MKFSGSPYKNERNTYELLENGKVIERFRLKATARYEIERLKRANKLNEYELRRRVTTKI